MRLLSLPMDRRARRNARMSPMSRSEQTVTLISCEAGSGEATRPLSSQSRFQLQEVINLTASIEAEV